MKNYLIIVKWERPYPKSSQYTESGSSYQAAISKALRKWRKENTRQIIKRVQIDATLLAAIKI